MAANAYTGAIFMFAGTFAPQNYAFCDGQVMSISSNTTLFAIIGTTYGGNGTTTFALPDLRGRVPIHTGGNGFQGQGPGLSQYSLGETDGEENHQLTSNELAGHSHLINAGNQQTSNVPAGNYLAIGGAYAATPISGAQLSSGAVASAGGGGAHNNRQPLLAVNFIICLVGIFPARN